MKTKRCAGALALIAAVILSSPFWPSMEMSAQSARPALSGPQFEVDPFWPKPLPERWVTGELGGVCVDANDRVFGPVARQLVPWYCGNRTSRAASHGIRPDRQRRKFLGRSSGHG